MRSISSPPTRRSAPCSSRLGPMASGDVEMARMVTDFRARCPKPVVVAWPLAIAAARASLEADGVHVFPEYSRAVRTMGRLASYAVALAAPRETVAPLQFDWREAVPDARPGLV